MGTERVDSGEMGGVNRFPEDDEVNRRFAVEGKLEGGRPPAAKEHNSGNAT